MTIQLTKDQERFVHDAVRAGLYASEDAVVSDALARLKETLPKKTKRLARKAMTTKVAPPNPENPLSPDELNERLLAAGLVLRLPNPAADIDDADDPSHRDRGEVAAGNHYPRAALRRPRITSIQAPWSNVMFKRSALLEFVATRTIEQVGAIRLHCRQPSVKQGVFR
jgi:Arc/MetJ-type ribon-helix-helix transcriptional regulator